MTGLKIAENCPSPSQLDNSTKSVEIKDPDDAVSTTIKRNSVEPIEAEVPIRPALDSRSDGGDSPSPQQPQIPQEKFSWWRKELLSWIMSALSLFSVIGTLIAYQNQEIPRWRYGITLNAIVAVLATMQVLFLEVPIASSVAQLKWNCFGRHRPLLDFVTIEKASQGPLGSLRLVFRWTGGLLCVFGALLLITILTIPPFLQQIVAYENVGIRVGHASMSTRRWYTTIARVYPYELKTTLCGALAGLKIAPPSIHSCASGNCTWPKYESLAICSRCVNVTNRLDPSGYLPYGFGIHLNNTSETMKDNCHSARLAYKTVRTRASNDEYPFSRKDKTNAVLHAVAVSRTNYSAKAEECILSFCTATFNATEQNGHLVETRTEETWPWSANIRVTNAPIWVPTIQDTHPFLISDPAVGTLRIALSQYFNCAVFDCVGGKRIYEWYPSGHRKVPTSIQAALGGPSTIDFMGITENVWNLYGASSNGTLEAPMRDAAERITTYLRKPVLSSDPSWNYALGNKQEFFNETGDALKEKTLVRVRWGWISLPVALEILALSFLLLVMINTQRRELIGWRGENIFSLFQGPEEELRELVWGKTNVESLERFAGSVNVRLKETEKGWRLTPI